MAIIDYSTILWQQLPININDHDFTTFEYDNYHKLILNDDLKFESDGYVVTGKRLIFSGGHYHINMKLDS